MRVLTSFLAGSAIVLLTAGVWSQGRGNQADWPTAYGDAQHTSWVRTDANISVDRMTGNGFALQWKTKLDVAGRPGESLTSGIVTTGVNIFTPLSSVAGPGNQIFAIDNDTGNLFWTRRFDGTTPPPTAGCAGGISGAPTRVVTLMTPLVPPARGGGGRGARAYSSAVGAPGEGVPLPSTGRVGVGAGAPAQPPNVPAPEAQAPGGQRGRVQGPAPPPSPFPTNTAAQGSGGIWAPSGTVYAVTADGMFRRLGLVSAKDVQRPTRLVPPGARFSDLIAVGDMAYTSTSGSCGGTPNGVWAIDASGEANSVVSWKTNGGDPIGSVVFSRTGTLFAAIGAGTTTAGGYANAIVALNPRTLTVTDWFMQPGVAVATAPIVLADGGRDLVAVGTRDGRLLLLDATSLGGTDHATPLFASSPLLSRGTSFSSQPPAGWQERVAAPPGTGRSDAPGTAAATTEGTRWLLLPVTGPLVPSSGSTSNGTMTAGAILAVKVHAESGRLSVEPGWTSSNIASPLTPIVVNGVVFAVAGAQDSPARLLAIDGSTGRTLWQSDRAMTRSVSGRSFWTGSGHVFVGTVDGTVYAFGFDMERGSPDQRP